MNIEIIHQDDRSTLSHADSGVYFVHKKNCVAQFSWGDSGSFKVANDAHEALTRYLEKRKDSEKLTVTLIQRR